MLSLEEAKGIDNLSPGNSLFGIGTNLRIALDGREVRKQDYVRYVDGSLSVSGNGETWDTAFGTITEGITWLNTVSGKGASLLIAPGFYIENAANVPTLAANDCLIKAVGLPEDTVWFGSGADGAVAAATDHLLTINGGNNHIQGLGLYVHKNTKASIVFDDTGGGYAGSFNLITGCLFSPQTQDGLKYCIQYSGGNSNIIRGNIFMGALTAAILLTGNVGNPSRNVIEGNDFIGTGIGINITSANYNTIIRRNYFSAGSLASENMANAIDISAGMNAGLVTVYGNYFEQSAANDILDNKAGGSLIEMDNNNGS